MSDEYTKRPISAVRGYNNVGLAPVTFLVTYDPGTDRINVTASQPVLTPVDSVTIEGEAGTYILDLGAHFFVDSSTTIHINTGSAYGPHVTQLDFFDGVSLVGEWIGDIIAMEPEEYVVTSASKTGPNQLTIIGSGFLGLGDGPVVAVNIVTGTSPLSTVFTDLSGQAGDNPAGISATVVNDTTIVYINPNMHDVSAAIDATELLSLNNLSYVYYDFDPDVPFPA